MVDTTRSSSPIPSIPEVEHRGHDQARSVAEPDGEAATVGQLSIDSSRRTPRPKTKKSSHHQAFVDSVARPNPLKDGPRASLPSVAWLSPEAVLRVPSEQLGVLILHRLTGLTDNLWGLHNFTTEYLAEAMPPQSITTSVYSGDELREGQEAVIAKLADAWTWLEQQRYLGPSPRSRPGEQWRALTPRGQEVLKFPVDDVLRRIEAGKLLGGALHPRIDLEVRATWGFRRLRDGNLQGHARDRNRGRGTASAAP